jgi:hypothetical protein
MTDMITRTKRGAVRLDETNWQALSHEERLEKLHVEGFTVIPGLLDISELRQVEAELADMPMNTAPYSDEQKFAAKPPQWHSRKFAEIIAAPRLMELIKAALGDDIVFMLGMYVRSGPGVPGLALHSDYQPYGSGPKGWNESSPSTLRVLIYTEDLTLEQAPFTIVPGSHISLHNDSNPYIRYDNHPDMVTLSLKAGDALVFNVKVFHGTHPHLGQKGRGMLEYAYRPAWAKCVGEVEDWDPEEVAKAPEVAKPYLRSRNTGEPESVLGTTLDAEESGFRGLAPF